MNDLGFVYCWTDHKTSKLYVGSHKGAINDGYIASSKVFLSEYLQRPQDFTRQIVAEGTYSDIRALESKILEASNAASNPKFYNRNNQNGKFYCDEEAGKKISKTRQEKFWSGPKYWSGKKQSEESNKKRSVKLKGKTPWNKNLTKDDPRVAQIGRSGSKTKKYQASLMTEEERKIRWGNNKGKFGYANVKMRERWADPIWREWMLARRKKVK